MVLLNERISMEHLEVFQTLSKEAQHSLRDLRPGWTYRGPLLSGGIFISFKDWEEAAYKSADTNDYYGRRMNYGMRRSKSSFLNSNITTITSDDLLSISNWVYCNRFRDHSKMYHYSNRLDVPPIALFVCNDKEILLNQSEAHLKSAEVIIESVKINALGLKKSITIKTDYKDYIGEGSTLNIAALDLFGKTYNAKHEAKRPSLSVLSHFKNVNITGRIFNEDTIELSKCGAHFYISRYYKKYFCEKDVKRIKNEIGDDWIYRGTYHLSEGDYHIISQK